MSTERFPPAAPDKGVHLVALGLGSNLAPRLDHIRSAAVALKELGLRRARFSSVFETEPVHVVDQPDFLNACGVGWTDHSPTDLLGRLKAIERDAGRVSRSERFGPRELDLDILLFADRVIETRRLTVPHRRLHERAFALVPLAEIAGPWVHPVLGVTIADLARRVDTGGIQATNLHIDPV